MTQDAVPANTHLIETLAKAFEDERTAIAYARQLAREGADVVEELTRVHNYPPQDQIKLQGGSGAPWYQDIFLFGCLCDVSS